MEDSMKIRCKLFGYTTVAVLTSSLLLSVPFTQAAANVVDSGKKDEVVKGENDAGSIKFTVGVGAGYLTGESHEMVYWAEYDNYKASELIWKIDSLYMANVNATVTIAEDWFIHFDGWFKVADGDGTMDDYDWLVMGADWSDWSHHEDTDVTAASTIDISAGWKAINNEKVSLSGLLGYKRDNFAWESYGGSYIYSEYGYRDSTGNFADGEPGIGYEQTFWSVYIGVGLDVAFNEMFSLSSRLIYSPLVQGEAVDHHYQRNLVTYDDFNDGNMLAFDITATVNITENLGVELGYSYLYYDEMQGDSDWHYNDEGIVATAYDGAGADHNSSLISIGLRYSF